MALPTIKVSWGCFKVNHNNFTDQSGLETIISFASQVEKNNEVE
jgi:hypothetical protein